MLNESSGRLVRILVAGLAAILVVVSFQKPIWTMDLEAPQYPKGLELRAFGDRLEGDIREINILNQYIGMKELSEQPAPEMKLFPFGIAGLLVLLLAAPFHRFFFGLATFGLFAFPAGILADMQYLLHHYGHSLDPDAPLRPKPFTPHVLGDSKIGQFESDAQLGAGLELILIAGVLMLIAFFITRRTTRAAEKRVGTPLAKPLAAAMILFFASSLHAATLQSRIDAASPGATLNVPAGTYNERLVIRKPLTLLAAPGVTIDGGGVGSVITIDSRNVEFRGFVVRNSGRKTTEEAAGIDVRGNGHRIIGNVVIDVHFGIHVTEGSGNVIASNRIRPGRSSGYRAGDGINLWSVQDSLLVANNVTAARDGIYLSFTDGITVRGNTLTHSRYGVHSMFSENITVERNVSSDNLLGAALMNSNRLVFRSNRLERNRSGATAYGLLLKDIGDLTLEDNQIVRNRIGIYADNTPDRSDRNAIIRNNLFLGNETAFALQSNVRLTVTGNDIIDNLSEARSEGSQLSTNVWSHHGRGNYWSNYRGFDRNGDGVGEIAFTVGGALDYMLQKNALVKIFLHTPAHTALDVAARMFPLFRAEPLLVDEHPLMESRLTRQEIR
jgi:nitrous oxidase accessory protein